jgi:pimeloyl-ACP methyl ester carboxylesterase
MSDAGATSPWCEPHSRHLELGTGITCHALEWDDPARSRDHTLILVHGFLDTAWSWAPAVSAGLAERFHVVAPEMRGHGDSGRVGPGGYYHFLDYVADLHEIVGRVGRERVSLVGHSMGGTIAGYYAGAYPDAIDRLALLEGLGPPEPQTPMPQRIRGWIAGWRRTRGGDPRSYASVEEAAERLRARDHLLDDALALELAARATTRAEDGSLRFKHDPLHLSMGPYPFQVALAAELWRAISCPILLVDGDDSEFSLAPDDRARRVACFSDPLERVLLGAGHMMQRHQPAALASLLLEFLEAS